jgi:hypothetical protein
MRRENLMLLVALATVTLLITIGMVSNYSGDKKYTIQTKHGVYHTDSFRIYGKGIVFDEDHRQVIVMGDFDITSKLNK